jgi:hypothetical protein
VDISAAAVELYQQGLSIRGVARALGVRRHATVHEVLVKAGCARRPNGTAHLFPPVEFTCGLCHKRLLVRGYAARNGNGVNARPNPPKVRFHARCLWIARKLYPPSLWRTRFPGTKLAPAAKGLDE